MFLAAVMMLLTTASPAMAVPTAAAAFGLDTGHESIPDGMLGHEHVPFPSS